MRKPLSIGEKEIFLRKIKNNKVIHGAMLLLVFAVSASAVSNQPAVYASANSQSGVVKTSIKSPIFEKAPEDLFQEKRSNMRKVEKTSVNSDIAKSNINLSDKIYQIVGEAPIKEMIPFISMRDSRVAAFLVGIAKKESGFGKASPSKDGQDCYNYWGYKGQGGRGSVLGYSCFASAEEAVETVGNRIQKLVEQNHTTPARMVVWKCGSSCDWDKPANVQSWISGVAQDFNKLVDIVG